LGAAPYDHPQGWSDPAAARREERSRSSQVRDAESLRRVSPRYAAEESVQLRQPAAQPWLRPGAEPARAGVIVAAAADGDGRAAHRAGTYQQPVLACAGAGVLCLPDRFYRPERRPGIPPGRLSARRGSLGPSAPGNAGAGRRARAGGSAPRLNAPDPRSTYW